MTDTRKDFMRVEPRGFRRVPQQRFDSVAKQGQRAVEIVERRGELDPFGQIP